MSGITTNTNTNAQPTQANAQPQPHTIDTLTAMLRRLDDVEAALSASLGKLGTELSAAETYALHKLSDERKQINAAIVALIHRS